MISLRRLVLPLGFALGVLAQRTTMAPATIATDDDDPHFMGYYIAPDSTERLTVSEGAVWATRGSYAGICIDDDDGADPDAETIASCAIPTACFNSRISMDSGDVMTCPDGSDCATFTIFQTSPFGGPVVTNYACRAAWVAHTVYRELVETQTTSGAGPSNTNTGAGPTNTSPPPDDNNDGNDGNDDDDNSKNSNLGAAIGGGIGGAAALLLLIGAGIFFYRRHKRPRQKHLIPQSEKDAAAAAAAAIWNNSSSGSGSGGGYTNGNSGYPNGNSGGHPSAPYSASVGYPHTPSGWSVGPDGKFYNNANSISGTSSIAPYGPNAYNQYNSQYITNNYPPGSSHPQSTPSELGTTTITPRARFGSVGGGGRGGGGQLPAELPGSETAAEVASPPMSSAASPANSAGNNSPQTRESPRDVAPSPAGSATTPANGVGTITVGLGAASPTMGTGMGSMNAVVAGDRI